MQKKFPFWFISSLIILMCIALWCVGYVYTDPSIEVAKYPIRFYRFNKFALLLSFCLPFLIYVFLLIVFYFSKKTQQENTQKPRIIWLKLFLICGMLSFEPYMYEFGKQMKIGKEISKEEYSKNNLIILRAKVLTPMYDTYEYSYGLNSSPIIAIDTLIDRTKIINTNFLQDSIAYNFNYDLEKDIVDSVLYVKYTGPSLLQYNGKWDMTNEEKNEIRKVLKHLKSKDTAQIKHILKDYIDLHKKYNLTTTLDIKNWFRTFYNPPLYPLNDETTLVSTRDNNHASSETRIKVDYDALNMYYHQARGLYGESATYIHLIISIYVAIILSLIILLAYLKKIKWSTLILMNAFIIAILSGVVYLSYFSS